MSWRQSKTVWRLTWSASVVAGIGGSFIFVLAEGGFGRVHGSDWSIVALVALFYASVVFAVARGIAWLVDVFVRRRRDE
jgi:hypothetical protein